MRDVSDEGVNGEGVVYVDGCGRGGAQRKGERFRSVFGEGAWRRRRGGVPFFAFSLFYLAFYIYIVEPLALRFLS